MWIATADQCRTIDQRASEEFGISSSVLMERAGLAVFDAVKDLLPHGGRLTVFCGKGNNGGDGFVVARVAHDHGFHVDCLVAAEEHHLSPAASEQMHVMRGLGVEPIFFSDARWTRKAECLGCKDLIIDALLGTGARNNVAGPVKQAIQAINRSGVPVVSVDVPSGISCDTGEELGESVWALRTITFGLPKPFLFQGIGLEHSGYWTVAEIGYPASLVNEATRARLIQEEWVANLLPERLRASHKGDNGNLLIVAGSKRMRGAATLVAKAALRSGIGLVTVASVGSVCDAVAAQVPEALLLPLPESHGVICAEAAHLLLDEQSRYDATVFGPGMTHDSPVVELLSRIWPLWEKPCVIDADALNVASMGVPPPQTECVFTPHPGEMGRLLQSSIAEVQTDRLRTVEQAVRAYRQCILLKGPYSIVGEPGQPMMVNSTGNPGMAAGGMGDTLCGIIGSLMSQDMPAYYAATCGMFWHGAAGDICAQEIGPIGYSAIDVANALPKARAKIVSIACDAK